MSRGVVTDKTNQFDKVQLIKGGVAGQTSKYYDTAGAIDPNIPVARISSGPLDGDDSLAMTLADPRYEGQEITLIAELADADDTIVITPTNLLGFATITFNATGESAVIKFVNSNWVVLGGNTPALA
jgi:hypothetical protein